MSFNMDDKNQQICQVCHNEANFLETWNNIFMCKSCHREHVKKYGQKPEYHIKFQIKLKKINFRKLFSKIK